MCSAKGSATPTVLIDNDRVRVTEWRFKALGDNTGWHRHEFDYVVVPLFTGVLQIDLGNGETVIAELTSGVPYSRGIGVEHDVINGNDFDCAFVEVELLQDRSAADNRAADA
ncbi:MAG: cupin domain-containing protein [Pseudomonadota bacterium]